MQENKREIYRSRIAGLAFFKKTFDTIAEEEQRAKDLKQRLEGRKERREKCKKEIERLTDNFQKQIESLLAEARRSVVDKRESVMRSQREALTRMEVETLEKFRCDKALLESETNAETTFDKAFQDLAATYAKVGAGNGVAAKNVESTDKVKRLLAKFEATVDDWRTQRERTLKAWRFSEYVASQAWKTLKENEEAKSGFRKERDDCFRAIFNDYCQKTRRFGEKMVAALTSLPLAPEDERRFEELVNDTAFREEASIRHREVKQEIARICGKAASAFANIPIACAWRLYAVGDVQLECVEPIELSKDAFYFVERTEGDGEAHRNFLQNFLFQTLRNEPVGGVDVLIADPDDAASWAASFTAPLANVRDLGFKIEYVDKSGDFEQRLNSLRTAARGTTRSLAGETLRNQNARNPGFAQKYTLLFANNLPRLLEGRAISDVVAVLCDLAELADAAGLTVVCCGDAALWQVFVEQKEKSAAVAKIKRVQVAPLSLESIGYKAEEGERLELVSVAAEQINRLTTFIKAARMCRNDAISFNQVMERVGIDRFGLLSGNEAKAPIGLDATGQPVYWVADNSGRGMTLIVGGTGSGKTNLMRGLITALANNYSPRELELYLIDLKDGVDFKRYATARLPHAKMVVIQGDPEVAVGALQGIVKRMEERANVLKGGDVNNLTVYRERYPNETAPRVVVLIDEYTRIFNEGNSDVAKELIGNQIIRLGRAYGFHIVLATQDLTRGTPGEILNNATDAIAMKCNENALGDVFGRNSNAKNEWRQLTRSGEAVVFGTKSDDYTRFRAPLIEDNEQYERYLSPILEKAGEEGCVAEPLVYDGQHFPAPSGQHFDEALAMCRRDNATDVDDWRALCGESAILGENVYLKLERARRQHALLVVGELEEERPCRDAIYSVWSRSLNYCRQQGAEFEIRLFDPKNVWAPFLDKKDLTVVSQTQELGALLFELYREVARREREKDETAKRILLILTQTEELKDELARITPPARTVPNEVVPTPQPNDSPEAYLAARFGTRREAVVAPPARATVFGAGNVGVDAANAQAALKYILEEGAQLGVCAIVSCNDALDAMQAVVGSGRAYASEYFAHIVSMRTSERNSNALFNSAKTARRGVGNKQRVVYSCGGEIKTFRPYYKAPSEGGDV